MKNGSGMAFSEPFCLQSERYKTVPLLYLPCDIELVKYSQKRETDSRLQGGNTDGSNFEGRRS